MEIGELRLGNIIVLRPVGRIDNETSSEFQARLVQLTAAATADVVVDLDAVEYMSSGGLRALVVAAKQKRAGRRVAVAGLHALVQEVLSIAHIEQVIPVFVSLEEAQLAWAGPNRSDERGGSGAGK